MAKQKTRINFPKIDSQEHRNLLFVRENIFFSDCPDEDKIIRLQEDLYAKFPSVQASRFVAALINSQASERKVCLVDHHDGVYRLTSFAFALDRILRDVNREIDWDGLKKHQIAPLAELFFKTLDETECYKMRSQAMRCEKKVCGKHPEVDELVCKLNSRFVEISKNLVEASQGTEFKKQMNSFMRAYNKNRQSLHDYIHQLFESYSRLLVIRLDLSYKTSGVMEWLGNPLEESKDSDRRSITVDDVIAHREQFIEHLREKFGKALKGYVWKLEYGSRKGYHYHTIVFLDGAKYREDVTIAKSLGNYWMEQITGNTGLYFNCNAAKIRYKSCAVGMRSHSDPDLWDGMYRLIDYLTKPDLWVRLHLPDNRRTFGKGGGLPKSTQPKRGRPRQKASTPSPRRLAVKEASDAPQTNLGPTQVPAEVNRAPDAS